MEEDEQHQAISTGRLRTGRSKRASTESNRKRRSKRASTESESAREVVTEAARAVVEAQRGKSGTEAERGATQESRGESESKDRMASQRASNRKSLGAEGGSLAHGEEDEDMELVDSPSVSLQKLLAEKAKSKASGKRLRDRSGASLPENSPKVISPQTGVHVTVSSPNQKLKLWLGFETMEKLAMENGQEPLFYEETIADRITRGISKVEATELEQVSVSFPRIPQLLYPNKRMDGIPGQHYNLTQVPSEIPIDPSTCLSLDFQISIHFQLPNTPLLHNHVKELVKNRLEFMNIPLGTNLIEPISILCMSVKKGGEKGVWAGIIKLHLLHPERDGIAMLKGLRPFILQLDPLPHLSTLGKVCKSYHAIARNNNLSVKITSDTLLGISPYALFCDVLENSFRRGHDFEVVDVQKSTSQNHAYIVAPTPLQAKKIQELHVSTHHEILEGQMKKGPNITLEQKQRKEALTLTLYNLPILMCIDTTSLEICKVLGTKNVVSIWFHKQDGVRHNGSANVECLNPYVYRKFVGKEIKIGVYHVEVAPHRRSLEGSEKPPKALLEKFGFNDTNTCLVDTIEAIQNQSQGETSATKSDVLSIMKEAIEEGNKKLKIELNKEMKVLKDDIVKEAHIYADNINDKLKQQMVDIQTTLALALTGMQQLTGVVNPTRMLQDHPNVD